MSNNLVEKYDCPIIRVEKIGLLYYVTDNQTDIVGKGGNMDAAIECYHRGIDLLQRRSAGCEWEVNHGKSKN